MDLLKYLEPMKNLPDRFSNLAFWRGVRKLKDDVVNAFEYIDSWGESIENSLGLTKISTRKCTSDEISFTIINVFTFAVPFVQSQLTISLNNVPANAKYVAINGTTIISETNSYTMTVPISTFIDSTSCGFWVGNIPAYEGGPTISAFDITLTFYK